MQRQMGVVDAFGRPTAAIHLSMGQGPMSGHNVESGGLKARVIVDAIISSDIFCWSGADGSPGRCPGLG